MLCDNRHKNSVSEEEKEKIEEMNEQLSNKLRILHQRYEDKALAFEKEKKSWADKYNDLQK